MYCSVKEYEEKIVKDIAHRWHRNSESEESVWTREGGVHRRLQINA
jgi:hypothetical protein